MNIKINYKLRIFYGIECLLIMKNFIDKENG